MRTNTYKDAFERGRYDAKRDLPMLFRKVGKSFEPTSDSELSDEWDQESREAYMEGYYSYL